MSILDELSAVRKKAYLEYLEVTYKMRNERNMFTDEKEVIKKDAYTKYKEIAKKIEELMFFIEQKDKENNGQGDCEIGYKEM